jgi:hypothetical protein
MTNCRCRFLAAGLDDPRIAVAQVGAAAGDQTDPIPLALEAEAVAVVLDFVEPTCAIGDGGCAGRKAQIEGAGHCVAERDDSKPSIDVPA